MSETNPNFEAMDRNELLAEVKRLSERNTEVTKQRDQGLRESIELKAEMEHQAATEGRLSAPNDVSDVPLSSELNLAERGYSRVRSLSLGPKDIWEHKAMTADDGEGYLLPTSKGKIYRLYEEWFKWGTEDEETEETDGDDD